jgi:hypothetical protein
VDAEKNKKLQQYASILTDQGKEAELGGKPEEAVKHYLKLVDVFLVLASEAPDHTTWAQFIRQAEAYQTRIRSLVPKEQPAQDISGRIPPPPPIDRAAPVSTGTVAKRPDITPSQSGISSSATSTSPNSNRSGPISKFLKPFQGKPEGTIFPDDLTSSLIPPRQSPQQPVTSQQSTQPPPSPLQRPTQQPPLSEDRSPVPHELYDRTLSENKILHERLQAVMKESDDKIAFLESRNRELEERVAMMISRSEYDELKEELDSMVPKHEYDRLKTELSNTVPITHYDQLLDRIANMVPREIYMASERRILELEDRLRHSVPLAVIDDIANEVSYVSILAEVPPIIGDISEEGKATGDEKDESESTLKLVKEKSFED